MCKESHSLDDKDAVKADRRKTGRSPGRDGGAPERSPAICFLFGGTKNGRHYYLKKKKQQPKNGAWRAVMIRNMLNM